MRLHKLQDRIRGCRKCAGLNEPEQTEAAPPHGDPTSPIMIVGQSNHAYNPDTPDRQIPFMNRDSIRHAGTILFPALANAGLDYHQLFTTNVLLCHPPRNRQPREHEIKACRCWLRKCVALVRPTLVVCLGNVAGEAMNIATKYRVSRATIEYKGDAIAYWGTLMPHPAYLLRLADADPERGEPAIEQFDAYWKWIADSFWTERTCPHVKEKPKPRKAAP